LYTNDCCLGIKKDLLAAFKSAHYEIPDKSCIIAIKRTN
jgi:hypothetical protein